MTIRSRCGTCTNSSKPVTKSKFIILQGHYEWQQPKSIVDDIQLKDSGVVRLHLRSYLIHKEHAQEMYDWGIEQDYWNYWMPDTHSLYMPECFLGEFYWSRAFHYHREQTNQWIAEGKWPRPIMLTTDSYTQENGYDDSTIKWHKWTGIIFSFLMYYMAWQIRGGHVDRFYKSVFITAGSILLLNAGHKLADLFARLIDCAV